DEQILEIETRSGEKRREVEEVQRKAGRFVAEVCDHRLCDGASAEELLAQVVFGGDDGAGQVFVFGEVLDELQNQRDIGNRGRLDAQIRRHAGMLNNFQDAHHEVTKFHESFAAS